jgi:hypothetical protein
MEIKRVARAHRLCQIDESKYFLVQFYRKNLDVAFCLEELSREDTWRKISFADFLKIK